MRTNPIARGLSALMGLLLAAAMFISARPALAAQYNFSPAAQSSYGALTAPQVYAVRVDQDSLNALVEVTVRNMDTETDDGDNDFKLVQIYPNGTTWAESGLIGATINNYGDIKTRTAGGVTSSWKCLGYPTCENYYSDGNGFTAVEFNWRKADGAATPSNSQYESIVLYTPYGAGCYNIVISTAAFDNWSAADQDTWTVFNVGRTGACSGDPYM